MEVNTPLIEAKALKKYFKLGENRYLHAVDNINLQIYKGTTVGIVGESGCGKSTFGRTLLRLTEPTSGEILYCGENILTVWAAEDEADAQKYADHLSRPVCQCRS